MRLILLISFLSLKMEVSAQALLNQSYQFRNHENALGFAGFNTFNTCVSQSVNYPLSFGGASGYVRLLGINTDGSTRFNTTLGGNGMFNLSRMSGMPLKKRTRDKGMIFVLSGWHCGYQTYYNVSCYAKVDSMGNTVFSKFFNVLDYNGVVDTISDSFYFIAEDLSVERIDPLTGVITNSIFATSANNHITAASVTSKKQIIISTTNSVTNSILIVDTLGNLINSKPASFVSKKILNVKSNFLFLNTSSNVIEKRDSTLQMTATYSCGSNYQVKDLDVFNDTIYLAIYNTSSKVSQIVSLDTGLNTAQTKTINNTYQLINGIQKDDKVKIMMNDYTGPIGWFPELSSDDFTNAGFAVFNSINDIQFEHDLKITNVTNLSCTTASISGYSQQSYTYQNKITIYNNSPHTVNSFNLNHPIQNFQPGSSQQCFSHQYFTMHSQSYSITINPYQSIDVTLPQLTGQTPIYTPYNPVLDLKFTYNVNSPNGKTESATANNTYTQTIHFDFTPQKQIPSSELELFPNPTEKILNLNSTIGFTRYTIQDLMGKKIMESEDFSAIDVSTLPSGLYFITLVSGKEHVTKKFFKK